MSTMIQIRNVPDDLHRRLKSRAALAGRSLSDFALEQLRHSLDRPTRAELYERLANLPVVDPSPTPAEIIRAERDSDRR